MTITHYMELLRNDAVCKTWLECYQTKICTEDGVAMSVRMWRIIENGIIVKDYLLHKPRRRQLEKYM